MFYAPLKLFISFLVEGSFESVIRGTPAITQEKQINQTTQKMKKILLLSLVTAMFSSCAGIRETNNQFTTHAECFRFFGNAIPADDQAAARALVPNGPNVKITSIHSTSADWTSVFGIIGNIIGLHSTTVSGTK